VPSRVPGVRAQAGEEGIQPGAVPLVVRRRAGAGPALGGLPVPGGRERGEERRRARLRQGRRGGPELAYVTARYAALAPFGKVAALLSELLPISGTQHASTVRSRTVRVGTEVVQANTQPPGLHPQQHPKLIKLALAHGNDRHNQPPTAQLPGRVPSLPGTRVTSVYCVYTRPTQNNNYGIYRSIMHEPSLRHDLLD